MPDGAAETLRLNKGTRFGQAQRAAAK